jgi:hypothetical protein
MESISNEVTRSTRVPFRGEVAVSAPRESNQVCQIDNLSQSGALLASRRKYLIGTELIFYMNLPLGAKRKLCMISGKVVRADDSGSPGVQKYGIQFSTNTSASSTRLIRDFIQYCVTGHVPASVASKDRKRFNPFKD